MIARKNVLTAIAAVALTAAAANADMVFGEPIVIQSDPQSVSLHFISSEAGWDGVLWLAAESAADGVEVPLFFNHGASLGDSILLGRYEVGQRLDFIYDVLTGETNSFRTDHPENRMQFGWEMINANTIRVGVEDIKLPGGDRDYNDLVFEIRTVTIPGPAAGMGLAMIGLIAARRRRGV